MSKIVVEPQATNGDTIWHIRVACWISKATRAYAHAHVHAPGHPHARYHAHTQKYIILIVFPWQQWLANAPHCYIIRTLAVLCLTWFRQTWSNAEMHADNSTYTYTTLLFYLHTLIHNNHSFKHVHLSLPYYSRRYFNMEDGRVAWMKRRFIKHFSRCN